VSQLSEVWLITGFPRRWEDDHRGLCWPGGLSGAFISRLSSSRSGLSRPESGLATSLRKKTRVSLPP